MTNSKIRQGRSCVKWPKLRKLHYDRPPTQEVRGCAKQDLVEKGGGSFLKLVKPALEFAYT